jgi:serine/threonine protein kinase
MKVFTCVSTDQPITLTKQIASSGEGEVWQTNREGYLAKIYYSPLPARIRKLEVMVAHPPTDPNAHINHISFAWPQSLLKDGNGKSVGFLMPAIAHSVGLLDVYNPQRRQKVLPGFNWLYLHTTAMNIASIVWAIHKAGYVLGDIKPQNILVNNQALPAVIDTDSFQVRNPQTGELYSCPVGSEGFTPVELMDKNLATLEQTVVHDRFRLAVIIFLLLFGDHPFKGKWVGAGDSPEPNELLRQGFWPYAPNSLIQSGPLTIPLSVVHPALQDCFVRCFNQGHTQPELRPTPEEWVKALRSAIAQLKVCSKVKTHCYSESYGKCYWCERKALLGVDIFPIPMKQPARLKPNRLPNFKAATETLKQRIQKQTPIPLLHTQSDVLKTLRIRLSSTGNNVVEQFTSLQNQLQEKIVNRRSPFPPSSFPQPQSQPSQPPTSQSPSTSSLTSPSQPQPQPLTTRSQTTQPATQTRPKPASVLPAIAAQTSQPQIRTPANPNSATPQPSPLPSLPSSWLKPGIVIGIVSVGVAIPIGLSHSQIDREALESTIFGGLLCVVLVIGCFLWLRVLDKHQP